MPITISNLAVTASALNGTTEGVLTAIDKSGNIIPCNFILKKSGGKFAISSNNLITAWTGSLHPGYYSVLIRATGMGTVFSASGDFVVTVSPGSAGTPTGIAFIPSAVSLPDTSLAGTIVPTFAVSMSDGSPFAWYPRSSPSRHCGNFRQHTAGAWACAHSRGCRFAPVDGCCFSKRRNVFGLDPSAGHRHQSAAAGPTAAAPCAAAGPTAITTKWPAGRVDSGPGQRLRHRRCRRLRQWSHGHCGERSADLHDGCARGRLQRVAQYVDIPLQVNSAALAVSTWFNAANFNLNARLVANSHTHNGFQLVVNFGGTSGFFDVGNGSSEGRATWFF